MQRLLITGAKGQLGQCFAAIAKNWPQFQCVFADKNMADITNQPQMAALLHRIKPYAVINCAAFTNVDLAQQQPDLAYAVNATAVKQLAQLCLDTHTLLVHISTDYVFSGKQLKTTVQQTAYTERDIAEPINVYGASKLAGEHAIQSIEPAGIIIRSSWLYSEYGNNFVRSIYNKIQQGIPLQVVVDQIGSPTYATELAALCLTLLSSNKLTQYFARAQLLHCAGQGETSWYQLAEEILSYTKQQTTITAISSKQWQSAATRPAYSALSSKQLQQQFGFSLPPWQQSLVTCLNKISTE